MGLRELFDIKNNHFVYAVVVRCIAGIWCFGFSVCVRISLSLEVSSPVEAFGVMDAADVAAPRRNECASHTGRESGNRYLGGSADVAPKVERKPFSLKFNSAPYTSRMSGHI